MRSTSVDKEDYLYLKWFFLVNIQEFCEVALKNFESDLQLIYWVWYVYIRFIFCSCANSNANVIS